MPVHKGQKLPKKQFDQDELFRLIEMGMPIEHACAAVGICDVTYYNRLKDDDIFNIRATQARTKLLAKPLEVLQADMGNAGRGHKGVATARWLLEKLAPKQFGHMANITIDAALSDKRALADVPDETLRRIIEETVKKHDDP